MVERKWNSSEVRIEGEKTEHGRRDCDSKQSPKVTS